MKRQYHARVLSKLWAQSWLPTLIALAYATWDTYSAPSAARRASAFLHAWGVSFFLIMWFVGQWFRAEKQLSDSENLDSLRTDTSQALAMLHTLANNAAAESTAPNLNPPLGIPQDEGPIERVLFELRQSPKAALVVLAVEMDRTLRNLLWSSGWIQGVSNATIKGYVARLMELGVVTLSLAGSVNLFLDVRDRLVHGDSANNDEMLRALDSGLTVLRVILAVPCEQNHVERAGVEVYEDAQASRVRGSVTAVVLRTTSPGGANITFRIFPTTRSNYLKGQRVSWEWNLNNVYGESWFKDLESGEIRLAWANSSEFIGRNLEDL